MDGADTPVLSPATLDRLPPRVRRATEWALEHWLGRLLVGCMTTSRRIELFDRSMTIAAQVFTSVLPILIAFATWFGRDSIDVIATVAQVPPQTEGVLEDVLEAPSDATFGIIGALVVLISATSLSRALTRACAAIWELPRPVSRLSAAWRWVAVVLALAVSLVAAHQVHEISSRLPPPSFWETVTGVASDMAIASFIPLVLLAGAVPLRRLLPGAVVFAVVMALVRPVSTVYLPHALDASAERYGSLGVAFAYLAWLYVISFCFLASLMVGKVVTTDPSRLGAFIRGDRAGRRTGTGTPEPEPGPAAG